MKSVVFREVAHIAASMEIAYRKCGLGASYAALGEGRSPRC